jgi:hypothetical protein
MATAVQAQSMAETRIRNIPDHLWRQFKSLCVLRGELVNAKVIELVEKYVDSMKGKS